MHNILCQLVFKGLVFQGLSVRAFFSVSKSRIPLDFTIK